MEFDQNNNNINQVYTKKKTQINVPTAPSINLKYRKQFTGLTSIRTGSDMIESDDSSDFTICADSDQTMRSKQSSMALRFQDNKGAAQMVNSVQDQTTKIETKNSKITKQNAPPDDI